MAKDNFNYEIVERVAMLSQRGNTTKELNRVSFNGQPPKWDLRSWSRQDDNELMLKGITLTDAELQALKTVLLMME